MIVVFIVIIIESDIVEYIIVVIKVLLKVVSGIAVIIELCRIVVTIINSGIVVSDIFVITSIT